MKFTVDDVEYELDLDRLTYDEAEFIYDNTGFGLFEFGDALRRLVPKAVKALIILGKRRAGIATRWQDIPGSIEISKPAVSILEGLFKPIFDAADAADAAEKGEGEAGGGAAPDPTTPGETPGSEPGTDPEPATSAT